MQIMTELPGVPYAHSEPRLAFSRRGQGVRDEPDDETSRSPPVTLGEVGGSDLESGGRQMLRFVVRRLLSSSRS